MDGATLPTMRQWWYNSCTMLLMRIGYVFTAEELSHLVDYLWNCICILWLMMVCDVFHQWLWYAIDTLLFSIIIWFTNVNSRIESYLHYLLHPENWRCCCRWHTIYSMSSFEGPKIHNGSAHNSRIESYLHYLLHLIYFNIHYIKWVL